MSLNKYIKEQVNINCGRDSGLKPFLKNNGITLIALVITIVVMLILVSIGLSLALGKGGLVEKAITGKQEARKSEAHFKVVQEAGDIVAKGQGEGLSDQEINQRLEEYFAKPEVQKEFENIQKENDLDNINEAKEKVLRDIGWTANTSSKLPSIKDEDRKPMILKIKPNYNLMFHLSVGAENMNKLKVDWGDGNISDNLDWHMSHEYPDENEYIIKIYGNFTGGDIEIGSGVVQLISWGENNFGAIQISNYNLPKFEYVKPLERSFESLRLYNVYQMELTDEFFENAPNLEQVSFRFYWPLASKPHMNFAKPIPANVFKNNPKLKLVEAAFSEITGYIGPIPENLFANNPKLENVNSCFEGSSGLTGPIPERLFANNPNLINLKQCFYKCTGLTEIPEKLFANNPKANHFESCFRSCSGLTKIPENLFPNDGIHSNLLFCFIDCTGLTGVAPEFWKKSPEFKETGEIPWNFTQIYYNCKNLSNYNELPKKVKG